ncbi:MAG TPA: dihydrolipoamide acetyltransferase family protein [Tepidisphaeraceae bacterium]|jgi:pyruvate dehydrogenase E2 component (dihydrolipoamide acetyltransferase)|nr:dihydrolipoamide acetyltransferase family protein [Tepidisphaeraceae bacterium]
MAVRSSASPNDFCLPDLGEGLEDAELIEWSVHVGQRVKENDTLAKMETAKALVEVPSPRAGTIAELHGKPGETIKVGAPLVTYQVPERAATAPAARAMPAPAPETSARGNGHGTAAKPTDERRDAGTVVGNLGGDDESSAKVRAAPAVRRLARDMGVDLQTIAGTGIGGRITLADVEAAGRGTGAAEGEAPAAPNDTAAPAEESEKSSGGATAIAQPPRRDKLPATDTPKNRAAIAVHTPAAQNDADSTRIAFRGVRRTIAEHLRHSINHAIHYTVMDEADVSSLDELRRRLMAASNEKITFLPFVSFAICRVLSGRFGEHLRRLNSTVDDEAQEIVQHRPVHLGIATDTDTGLMVPVIRNADRMGVLEIGRHIARIARSARERSIAAGELHGSTFTISNFGSMGGRFGTPVINYPEAAILAVGRAREGVVVRRGMLGVGKILPLSLSCDHRVIDGATAATALSKIIDLLQSPDELLPAERSER